MKHPKKFGICYVVHQGFGDIFQMFGGRNDLLKFPEHRLNQFELRKGLKYKSSIITEAPELISCYDFRDVYIWENGEWINPEIQTYATSFEIIASEILGFGSSIPMSIISEEQIEETEKRLVEQYKI